MTEMTESGEWRVVLYGQTICVRLKNAIIGIQRCIQSNAGNLQICYLTWQKGLGRCGEVKNFEMEDCPGLCGWAQCNHNGSYNREAGGSK